MANERSSVVIGHTGRTRLIHLPVHASWLNQVEVFFSILQRKAIAPVNFADLDTFAERVLGFQHRYNQTAKPFN